MDRLLKFIGLATVIVGVVYSILHLKFNSDTFNEVLRIFGLVSAIALIGFIVARLLWGKNWILKGGATMLVGSDLIGAFKLFLDELPTPSKATTANLSGHLVYRFTRLGVIGLLLAMIPVTLLWQQNQKIDEQTKLFEKQNEKIDAQIELDESSRRGNLIVMMSNIMDKVDEELKERERMDSSRMLSQQLIGRIAALSYAFRPYRFWQDSSLIEKPLSPERGQLLIALVQSQLSPNAYNEIFRRANFSQADLRGANLRNSYLFYTDLRGANMKNADLTKSILNQTRLNNADLERAVLNETQLSNVNFTNANLHSAQFYAATIMSMVIDNANVEGIYLRSAKIFYTNFNNILKNSNFFEAHIEDSEFEFCDLSNSDFRLTTFKNNSLVEVKFDNVKVTKQDWLTRFGKDNYNRKGTRVQIKDRYVTDTILLNDRLGTYYLIKPKEGGARNWGR